MIPPAAVILIALVLIAAAVVAVYEFAAKLRPYPDGFRPRHARDPFPDPADRADPDGSAWLTQLHAPVQAAPLDRASHFHHEAPTVAMETLERIRAGLLALPVAGELPMGPGDPPPDPTVPLPKVVCDAGLPPDTEAYLDGLFAPAYAALDGLQERAA
jgi:hypothetical protein